MTLAQTIDAPDLRLSPTFGFEFRASPKGEIEGLASPFGGRQDTYGDRIAEGAFKASLARHTAEGTAPAMLWQHDGARPIGRWTEFREGADGLHVKGQFALKTQEGAEAFEHARSGSTTGLSIGGFWRDWKSLPDDVRLVTEIDLIEVSLVSTPAANRARIHMVRSAAPLTLATRADLAALLRDAGLSRGAADKLSRGGWPALTGNTIDDTDLADIERQIRAVAAAFNKGLK